MIPEIAVCGAAGFLFLRGFFHAGGLSRMLWDNRPRLGKAGDNCADCQDAGQCLHNGRCRLPAIDAAEQERKTLEHEHRLADGSPMAFWLDYARKAVVGHIDEDKERRAKVVLRDKGVIPPADEDDWHYGMIAATVPMPNPKKLPCGCIGKGPVTIHPAAWGNPRHTECMTCHNWWEPASNDPTGRRLAQGDEVQPPKLPCGCTGVVHTRAYPSHGGWDAGRYAVCNTCAGTWDYNHDMRRAKKGSKVEWPNGNKLRNLPLDLPPPPAI